MKHILVLLLAILSLPAFSQQDRYDPVPPPEGSVFQFPEMDHYKGVWRGEVDGITLTLILTERYSLKAPALNNASLDFLVGYHEISENGKILSSSLSDRHYKAKDKRFTVDFTLYPRNFSEKVMKLVGSIRQDSDYSHVAGLEGKPQSNQLVIQIISREGIRMTSPNDPPRPENVLPRDKTFVLDRVK